MSKKCDLLDARVMNELIRSNHEKEFIYYVMICLPFAAGKSFAQRYCRNKGEISLQQAVWTTSVPM
jgi:hypothetical protein